MSDAIDPLYSYSQIGKRYTVDEASKKLVEPGVELSFVANQFRGFVQRRLVQVREKRGSGRTAANLFELDDLAVAKILSLLVESGISDNEVLLSVSTGLYNGLDEERAAFWKARKYQTRHSISTALSGFVHGEHWALRISFMRQSQTGERSITALVYNPDVEDFRSDLQAGYVPRSVTVIDLPSIFERLLGSPEKAN